MAYTTINKSTDHIRIKTFTGNGNNDTAITWDESSNMQPDWLWFKNRDEGQSHALFDVLRGATKRLVSNESGAEGTEATNLDSFDTNGFTVDNELIVNGSGDNMVTWGWKAGGTGSSNTDGSITSSVSANTTNGFSIVKYTGTGAGATVGHGLNVKPNMIIVKNLGAAQNWAVYHSSLGATKYLDISSDTGSANDLSGYLRFNSTEPTTSVFSVGQSPTTSGSGQSHIAYCFAEKPGYSKFGSYTGNGNVDGPFIYTGFKPAWVMIKRTDTSADWRISDNKRPGYNLINKTLYANGPWAEGTGNSLDHVSNGFKFRDANTADNASGGTYIYMAFGQSIVGSNNVPATAR